MTGSELAKALGIDRSTMSRWRAKGCPSESLEAARAWAESNLVATGRPRGRTGQLVPKRSSQVKCGAPRAIPEGLAISGTPDDLLQRMKEVELIAHQQVKQSLSNQSAAATWGVKVHKDAARNVLDMEKACLRAREYEQSLVSRDWVRLRIAKHDGTMIKLVRAMPRRLAPRLVGQPIDLVERELRTWVENHFLKNLHASNGE
jgi:transcriptional regulator with XRE-family HTH domain